MDLRNRPSGWRGERVVAFEDRARHTFERVEQMRATPVTMASGSLKGMLIQEREDFRKARERSNRAANDRSRASMAQAIKWAASVGFPSEQQSLAASAALTLRGALGPGRVTRRLVLDRCRAQYPELFESTGQTA